MLKINKTKIKRKNTSASIGRDLIILFTTIFISAILLIVRSGLSIRIVRIAEMLPALTNNPAQPTITTVKSNILNGSRIYEYFSNQKPKLIILSIISIVKITKNIISAIL